MWFVIRDVDFLSCLLREIGRNLRVKCIWMWEGGSILFYYLYYKDFKVLKVKYGLCKEESFYVVWICSVFKEKREWILFIKWRCFWEGSYYINEDIDFFIV